MPVKKYTVSLLFFSMLFSASVFASEMPSLNYPASDVRGVGDMRRASATGGRNSSAFFPRYLGTQKKELLRDFPKTYIAYHIWDIEKQNKINVFRATYREMASKLWAAYMFEDKVVSGYALVSPLFLTTYQDGVFDNEPFFQQLYQLPQAPQWLNLNLPPGYTLRLYRAPHASQVEVYGILETPRGIKALVLETFFPQELESWLKPQIKQYLKDLILSFELSYERYIPAGN